MIFLDTSALAKRYVEEPDSCTLEALFHDRVKEAYVSTLALPEFAAALGRKVRFSETSRDEAFKAMRYF